MYKKNIFLNAAKPKPSQKPKPSKTPTENPEEKGVSS